MANALSEAMAKVVEVLAPLDAEQRKRVIQAAQALLGDEVTVNVTSPSSAPQGGHANVSAIPGVPSAASAWLQKAGLTNEHLEQCLHFDDGKTSVIALPGHSTKRIEQVVTTYLMQGVAAFLSTGEAAFTDSDARSLCEHFGCYDHTNHAKYMREFGNRITGSKGAGWKLTAPGLTAAATLMKSHSE